MQNAIRIFDFNLKERVSGVWDENIPIIHHAVVECVGVERHFLIKDSLIEILSEIIQELGLHIVDTYTHNFIPQGNTIIFVLEESHFAAHSWPERGYIHIDLVTCSPNEMLLLKLADVFNKYLNSVSIRVIRFKY